MPLLCLKQDVIERQKVAVPAEQLQTPIGAVEHVIDRSARSDAKGSRQERQHNPKAGSNKGSRPFQFV